MLYFHRDLKTLYIKDGDTYINVGVTVKEKRREIVEIESVSVVRGEKKLKSNAQLTPITIDEALKKFGITEKNPVKPIQSSSKKSKE